MLRDAVDNSNLERLRAKAEALLASRLGESPADASDIKQLLHDLLTYRIELELQNEELCTAQLELQELNQKYRDLYDFAPLPYFTLDSVGKITELNFAAADLLGMERARLVGRSFGQFVEPDPECGFARFMKTAFTAGSRSVAELKLCNLRQQVFHVRLEAAAPQNETQQLRLAVVDISDRVASEQRKRELAVLGATAEAERRRLGELEAAFANQRALNEALRQTQAELVQAEKMVTLGHLVSGLAHELNNPLFLVRGNLERLRKGLERGAAVAALQDNLQEADAAAERMCWIIRDLGDFSRKSDSFRPIEVQELFDRVLRIVGKQFELDNIAVSALAAADLPFVQGDLVRLEQVLLNLVFNAHDALMAGRESGRELRLSARAFDRSLLIEVWDNGPGIPEIVRARIFEPFFTTKEPGQGTGLGLAICSRIIDGHRGKLTVESNTSGTTFQIRLPL